MRPDLRRRRLVSREAARLALLVLAIAVLLGGILTALLVRTSQVVRRPCVAGLREEDCGMITDYHMGLRWTIVSAAVLILTGLLLGRHVIRDRVNENAASGVRGS